MIGSGNTPCLRARPRPRFELHRRSTRLYVSPSLTSRLSFHVAAWIDERTPARSGASHLDYHRLAHFDEMGDVCGVGVEASRRQRFQRRRIELLAIAGVPSDGQDRHLAVIRMGVRSELVSRGKLQTER